MATLSQLPEDIIFLVFEHLERERLTLCILARVCRQFHQVTRRLIYRHIGNIKQNLHKQQLRKIFQDDPELISRVHSCDPIILGGRGDAEEQTLSEVLSYPNLRELRVHRGRTFDVGGMNPIHTFARGRTTRAADFECTFLHDHSFSAVREVILSTTDYRRGTEFSTTEIVGFALLPNVRHLYADEITRLEPVRALPESFRNQLSNLTSLDILGGKFWNVEASALRSLFQYCARLKRLHCQIPMTTKWDLGRHLTDLTEPVRPSSLAWMLQPLQNTLQSLKLVENRISGVYYDNSRLDLSQFASLEELQVPSCCLFPEKGPCDERYEAFRLLPYSSNRLHLDFPRSSGVFYYHADADGSFLAQDSKNIPKQRYDWLYQFTQHKSRYFPRLRLIKMIDPPGDTGFYEWSKEEWSPPEDIRTAFTNQVIDLEIEIRFPNPNPAPEWATSKCKGVWNTHRQTFLVVPDCFKNTGQWCAKHNRENRSKILPRWPWNEKSVNISTATPSRN